MYNETKNEYEEKIFNCKLFKIIVNVKSGKIKLPALIINYPNDQSHKIRKPSLCITEPSNAKIGTFLVPATENPLVKLLFRYTPSKWLQYIWACYIYASFGPIAWKDTNYYTNKNNIAIKLWSKMKQNVPSLIASQKVEKANLDFRTFTINFMTLLIGQKLHLKNMIAQMKNRTKNALKTTTSLN